MIDTPQMVQTTVVATAIIRLAIPREQIRTVMGPGLGELMAALRDQGIAAAGPWFTHHLRRDPATFDFEICVPVTRPVAPVGRVTPGQLPTAKVARTVYHGPYEALGAAWMEFDAWIAAQGRRPAPDLWEVYLTDPQANPDPTTWRTELNRPLAG